MGAKNTKIDSILYYYIFQKKINNYLNNTIKRKDKTRLKNGYIINPEWIKEWKRRINYDKIVSDYLVHFNINTTKLNNEQLLMINQFIENDYLLNNLCYEAKTIRKYKVFFINDELITRNFLENLVNDKTFEKFGIKDDGSFEKVKFIFKEKMFILFIERYHVIKILLFTLIYKNEIFNLINLTLIFNEIKSYEYCSFSFEESKSDKIIDYLYKLYIFENDSLQIKKNNRTIFRIKNENYKEILKRIATQQDPLHQGDQDQPSEESFVNNEKNKINFQFNDTQKNNNISNINNNFYQNSMLNFNNNFQNNNENDNFKNNSFFHNNIINNYFNNNNIEQNIDNNEFQNNIISNKEYELNKKINELENLLNKEKMKNSQLKYLYYLIIKSLNKFNKLYLINS